MFPREMSKLVVNRSHPLNSQRQNWYLALPACAEGDGVWRDMMGRVNMVRPTGTLGNTKWHLNGAQRQNAVFMGGANVCWFAAQQSKFVYPTSAFTFMAWVKQNGTPFAGCIAGEEVSGGATSCRFFMQAQKIHMKITCSGGTTDLAGATTSAGSVWLHVAATWDGTNLTVYLNGVQDATTTTSGTFNPPSTRQFHIGRNTNFGDIWNGWLNDIGIWRRALTISEIKQYIAASRNNYQGLLIPQQLNWRSSVTPPVQYGGRNDDRASIISIRRAAARRNVAHLMPISARTDLAITTEAITVDKFHVQLSQPARKDMAAKPRSYAQECSSTDANFSATPLPPYQATEPAMTSVPPQPFARRGVAALAENVIDRRLRPDEDDSYQQALTSVPPQPFDRRGVAAQAKHERDLTSRPDAEDPAAQKTPWPSLDLPVRPGKSRADRRYLYPFENQGQPPAPEVIDTSKFLFEVRLPPRRRVAPPELGRIEMDGAHLLDAETVFQPAFDVPLSRVLPGRPRVLYIPDSHILWDEVFPEDPIAYTMPPWHVAMGLPVLPLRPRHFWDWLALVLTPDIDLTERPDLKFHTPLSDVLAGRRKASMRPWGYDFGRLDMSVGDRLEHIFADDFAAMAGRPPYRAGRSPFIPGDLELEPNQRVEQIFTDALGRQDLPTWLRQRSRQLLEILSGQTLESSGFSYPAIVHLRRWMLSAGFWRARL